MENNIVTERFLGKLKTDRETLIKTVSEALKGAEDGELFLCRSELEHLGLDDRRIDNTVFTSEEGYGLRRVSGEQTGYVTDNVLDLVSLKRSGEELSKVFGAGSVLWNKENALGKTLYKQASPFVTPFPDKVAFLHEVDDYVRSKDKRVRSVSASIIAKYEEVLIVRPDGLLVSEIRPLVRFNLQIILADGTNRVKRGAGYGGRGDYSLLIDPTAWKKCADRTLEEAQLLLTAKPCPAMKMDLVLGNGWNGVMLHEAFGHMMEGDFIYKGTSGFSNSLGKRVAAPGVTVVDEGNIPGRRGSLSFDDEGTPTGRTVLVEDGILVGFMHDRLSARMLGVEPTGNGRRESFAKPPIPRMTNTHMLAGTVSPEEIIADTKKGLYVGSMGGGQVDITSGQFVFEAELAWVIENGKLAYPVKRAALTGSGPEALLHADMIGNDAALDDGVGTCGKDGQSVPVGVGQPTLRIRAEGITIGGNI